MHRQIRQIKEFFHYLVNIKGQKRQQPEDVEAYEFATKTVEEAVVNKIMAKVRKTEAEKPKGRSVDALMERLNLLEN